MRRRPIVINKLVWAAFALPFLTGCAVFSDAINPNLITSLGFDPNSILSPRGTVIIVFNNETTAVANFFAYYADGELATATQSSGIATSVDPNSTKNQVLECNGVAIISPGQLGNETAATAVAAEVIGAQNAVQVNYTGSILRQGIDYTCGDVVEIRLVAAGGTDQQQAYAIIVRVLPGS